MPSIRIMSAFSWPRWGFCCYADDGRHVRLSHFFLVRAEEPEEPVDEFFIDVPFRHDPVKVYGDAAFARAVLRFARQYEKSGATRYKKDCVAALAAAAREVIETEKAKKSAARNRRHNRAAETERRHIPEGGAS